MGEGGNVKLHGMWASPYANWVKYALKLKGIEFEYIEEDLPKKSELLLQYNPVHKKVPVLVHNGLPIAESTIILEYIDETWTDTPRLLPKDPFLRAKHRFWAAYFQLVLQTMQKTLLTEGEAHENVKAELLEKLDVVEQGIMEVFQNGNIPSFKDEKPGYLDIMFYSIFETSKVLEEYFHNITLLAQEDKLMAEERYRTLFAWHDAINENPEVKEISPPKSELLVFLEKTRQKYLRELSATA